MLKPTANILVWYFWNFIQKQESWAIEENVLETKDLIGWTHYGPTQVKCRLLISSIFDAMNFQHFLKMLEIMF